RPGDKRGAASSQSVSVDGAFSANNSEASRDAALDGLGVALLPDFSAQGAIRSGHISGHPLRTRPSSCARSSRLEWDRRWLYQVDSATNTPFSTSRLVHPMTSGSQ